MALRTYVKDAWEDIEDFQCPVDDARETADCARIWQKEAWEDVWTAVQFLVLWEETLSTGCLYSNDEQTNVMAVDDSGTIAFVTEKGDFSDATISLAFEGGVSYTTSAGTQRYAQAGTLSVFGIDASGNKTTLGSKSVGSSSAWGDEEEWNLTATGDFVRIGWKMEFKNWNISPTAGNIVANDLYVRNFRVDNKKYWTNPENDYDHNDWYN